MLKIYEFKTFLFIQYKIQAILTIEDDTIQANIHQIKYVGKTDINSIFSILNQEKYADHIVINPNKTIKKLNFRFYKI
jgi:hypothetical protein